MKDITKRYINQIINTNFHDFSAKTIEHTKKAILDTVGCIIAGVESPIGRSAITVLGGFGGVEESTVIGDGRKLPAQITAYITGQCAVGPDMSDNYKPGSIIISHPGEAVVPAVLALAEKIGASLQDVFVAIVLGYETAGRYALAIEPRRPEVYSFSTHYSLAAGVACAKLLDFDENQAINSLGIAGTLAPLPATMAMWGFRESQRPASWHRDMPGHACFSALLSCLFAQTDFKATHLLLEDDTGYFKIAGSDNYNPEKLFDNWGNQFVIDSITYKSIPSCYFNQPCIEAVRLLMEENDLQIDDIQKIDLYAPTQLANNFSYYPPDTSVDTASSVKYLTAMYILTKEPGPHWYLDFDRYLKMEAYQNIARKIEVHPDGELQTLLENEERLFGKAEILTGTKLYEKIVNSVRGCPENPFEMIDLENKFKMLSEPIIGKEKAEKFTQTIRECDPSLNIRDIISEL